MKRGLGKRNKILIGVLTPVCAVLLAFLILCFVTIGMYSSAFLGRVLTHWDSHAEDYKIFPERTIERSDKQFVYAKNIQAEIDRIGIDGSGKRKPLREFVKDTKTTSFLIVKNDEIVYEQYANGYDENSMNTSFSMAKSVVSLMVGRAIEGGYIQSVKECIENYIPEFQNLEIGKVTVEELLLMRSDIEYDEGKFLWFGDDSLTYWHDDLRALALGHTKLTNKYGGKFHYNNYHPLLLGIILERSTKMSVSAFFEREIWQKIGAENPASWSLDGEKSGFEKMESGINFRAADFLKIGSMILHGGDWNGMQIVGKDWLNQSTLCSFPINNEEYAGTFLADRNIGYRYMWYCTPSQGAECDIFAWGKSDQILYISPANNVVILRTGKSDGGISDWIGILKNIAREV